MPDTDESRQQYSWDHLSPERQKALIEVADNMIAGRRFWKFILAIGSVVTGAAILVAAIVQSTNVPIQKWWH